MNSENIRLRRTDEPKSDVLPRGVVLIIVGDNPVFVRRSLGRFVPLPKKEQEELRKKHIT